MKFGLFSSLSCRLQADVSIYHEFHTPPWGGGNQFLLALKKDFERRGLRIAANKLSRRTGCCLINSHTFDVGRFRRHWRQGCRIVHRVDGPIGLYRGQDDGSDRKIWEINREFATATVFQSRYSLESTRSLGLEFKNPVVIMNTVDATIFFPPAAREPLQNRKVRLISVSWSNNPNKGLRTCQWLDEHLDQERFEYTYVGRPPARFKNIRLVPPLGSRGVAELLRGHDIVVMPSLNEACSNALLESLACGLPALYARSGSSPEIAGEAGYGYDAVDEIPRLLDRLVGDYERRRSLINIPSLPETAARYLGVLGLEGKDGTSQPWEGG